jgi:hypothetical protein
MIARIILTILLLAFGMVFFMMSNYFYKEGAPVVGFCNEHYRNDTFKEDMYLDGDIWKPLACKDAEQRIGWYGYCNATCFENYDRCLKENATEEQIKFYSQCHWMGADYLTIAGTIGFGTLSIAMLAIAVSEVFDLFRGGMYETSSIRK